MATFSYKAVSASGHFSEGHVEAADTRTAAYRLQSMGLIPVSIEEPRGRRSALPKLYLRRVSRKDVLFFTEELATLVHAGLPLDRSLTITAELASKPALRIVINDVLSITTAAKPLVQGFVYTPSQPRGSM